MRKLSISVATIFATLMADLGPKAQVGLSAYADPEGFFDVLTLTCA
jgi:hypothetical protein